MQVQDESIKTAVDAIKKIRKQILDANLDAITDADGALE